jgi:hypothetical protein
MAPHGAGIGFDTVAHSRGEGGKTCCDNNRIRHVTFLSDLRVPHPRRLLFAWSGHHSLLFEFQRINEVERFVREGAKMLRRELRLAESLPISTIAQNAKKKHTEIILLHRWVCRTKKGQIGQNKYGVKDEEWQVC